MAWPLDRVSVRAGTQSLYVPRNPSLALRVLKVANVDVGSLMHQVGLIVCDTTIWSNRLRTMVLHHLFFLRRLNVAEWGILGPERAIIFQ